MASRKYPKSKNHAIEGNTKQMIMRLLPVNEPFEKSVIKATKVCLAGSGEIIIDWGDGTSVEMYTLSSDDNNMSAFTHSYACKIVHTINIIGENITHLLCNGIGLTSIDVSTNYVLEKLGCSDNKLRFSGQSDYHVVRSNIVNEYSCLFAFLTQKEKYSSIRDEEYSLHDNINIIKKMTGLGNELI